MDWASLFRSWIGSQEVDGGRLGVVNWSCNDLFLEETGTGPKVPKFLADERVFGPKEKGEMRKGERDKGGVEEWYRKYRRKLLNFILLRVKDQRDAEEILDDTFLSAWDSLPLFSGKSSFFTWLCGIAKHEIADYYRKKKIKTILFSHLPFLENLASKALGPEEEMLKNELKEEVVLALGRLEVKHRRVLVLKYLRGERIKEIAKEIGKTVSAVESLLFRARKALAKELVYGKKEG